MDSRLKELRKALDLTQKEFAESLGLKQNTIATYEMGRTKLSERTITDICRIHKVNEFWLRYGEGEMFRTRSRDDEIAAYISGLLGGDGGEFQQQFIAVLARLSPDEWKLLEKMAVQLAAESKNPAE